MRINRFRKPKRDILEEALSSKAGMEISPYLKEKVLNKAASDLNAALYVATEGRIVGLAFLNFLKWDSNIFGFKIGRIENITMTMSPSNKYSFLNRIILDCKRGRYRHISCRIGLGDLEELRLLERLKFNVADMQITLCAKDLRGAARSPALPEDVAMRKAGKRDLGNLKELVKGIFTDTRFVADKRYPVAGMNRMYYEWIKNSIYDAHKSVFVAEDMCSGALAGFSICNFDPVSKRTLGFGIGSVDLIAVKDLYRNRGIGGALIKYSIAWLKKYASRAEIRTQVANAQAIGVFMKNGFNEFTQGIVLPAGISMHRWFNRRHIR